MERVWITVSWNNRAGVYKVSSKIANWFMFMMASHQSILLTTFLEKRLKELEGHKFNSLRVSRYRVFKDAAVNMVDTY